MIDRQTIERILDAAQIVDVIQEFVPLKKRELTIWDCVHSTMKRHLHSPFRPQKKYLNVSAAERSEIRSIL